MYLISCETTLTWIICLLNHWSNRLDRENKPPNPIKVVCPFGHRTYVDNVHTYAHHSLGSLSDDWKVQSLRLEPSNCVRHFKRQLLSGKRKRKTREQRQQQQQQFDFYVTFPCAWWNCWWNRCWYYVMAYLVPHTMRTCVPSNMLARVV